MATRARIHRRRHPDNPMLPCVSNYVLRGRRTCNKSSRGEDPAQRVEGKPRVESSTDDQRSNPEAEVAAHARQVVTCPQLSCRTIIVPAKSDEDSREKVAATPTFEGRRRKVLYLAGVVPGPSPWLLPFLSQFEAQGPPCRLRLHPGDHPQLSLAQGRVPQSGSSARMGFPMP